MSTASRFDNILKSELNVHAAWLPVTNAFALGDFGVVSDGVLAKMGNIGEFGVDWVEEAGPPTKLDYTSEGTRIIRMLGNAQVQTLPDQDLDASLTIEFRHDSSFLVKAGRLTVRQFQNLNAIAEKLGKSPRWKSQFRVVSAVYIGQRCTILSSKGENSKIELKGKANALKQLDLGSAAAEIDISTSEKIGLQIVGQTGVVGLSLFKLRWLIGGVHVLAAPSGPGAASATTIIETDKDASWGKELPDDV
jgi:hypothetical protein